MDIKQSDIDTVESAGVLDGQDVKLIRLRGGLWMAISKTANSIKEKVLSVGSHPAIVKFNVKKQFPNFQMAMYKSEVFANEPEVEDHSHFLSEDLLKSGYELYSLQDNNSIEFQISKNGIKEVSVASFIMEDSLFVNKTEVKPEFSRALAGAALEKTLPNGIKKIKIQK